MLALDQWFALGSAQRLSSTPGSPSKFLMAAFVRVFAQKVTAEICPVQPFVNCSF